jgi:hypothetical protein
VILCNLPSLRRYSTLNFLSYALHVVVSVVIFTVRRPSALKETRIGELLESSGCAYKLV